MTRNPAARLFAIIFLFVLTAASIAIVFEPMAFFIEDNNQVSAGEPLAFDAFMFAFFGGVAIVFTIAIREVLWT